MREIILDIETTGLEHKEGHRVIEIGCIELNSKEVGASYHQYINPSKTLTAVSYTHLTLPTKRIV